MSVIVFYRFYIVYETGYDTLAMNLSSEFRTGSYWFSGHQGC